MEMYTFKLLTYSMSNNNMPTCCLFKNSRIQEKLLDWKHALFNEA